MTEFNGGEMQIVNSNLIDPNTQAASSLLCFCAVRSFIPYQTGRISFPMTKASIRPAMLISWNLPQYAPCIHSVLLFSGSRILLFFTTSFWIFILITVAFMVCWSGIVSIT